MLIKQFIKKRLNFALTMVAALMLTGSLMGCNPFGYSAQPLHPKGIKRIYVPMPTRAEKVFMRDIEQGLHENLVKHVQMRTSYTISKRANADAELVCEIVDIIRANTSINPDTDVPRETELTFIINVKMKNIATGNTVFEEPNMRIATTYLPYGVFKEDLFTGSEDLYNKIARQIIDKMEAGY